MLALSLDVTWAGTRDPDTPDSKYVEFGKQFPFVRRIRSRDPKLTDSDSTAYWYGSAVLIKPHWILTAAHVIEHGVHPTILSDNTSTEYPIIWMRMHPEFKNEKHGYYDIALGYSEKDFNLDFYPMLYKGADEAGQVVTLAGFGFIGTFHSGMDVSDGKRRAGSNKISGVDREVLICDPSKQGKTALEFLITPGDSGGGLFIGNKLAGIHSFLIAVDGKPNGTYTDESAHTRVSLYADWVESEIQKYERAQRARATEGQTPILNAVQ
jgi:hypothetical protein